VAFVFSDEPEWCPKNLDLGVDTVFVGRPPESRDWEHMALMSRCRDHVISNSSFSWWGAWLGDATDKIVIAPQRWFADDSREARASRIVPPQWLRV
jgi:hypothetical protein